MTQPPAEQPDVPPQQTPAHAFDAALTAEPMPAIDAPSAEPVPTPQHPPRKHRDQDLGGLRIVIVVWCFWLLGAWAAAWLSDSSVPRVRWMLFAGSFGLMLVWPAFRLSERTRPGVIRASVLQALLDWLAMITVYQAVIWSLHLIAAWRLERGLWLDLAVISWSLLSALIVAVARLWPGGAARWVGMLLCIALVFAEPVAIWVSIVAGGEGWAMSVSPVQAFWELTQTPGRQSVSPWDRQVLLIAFVAVMGWASLGVWALGERLLKTRRSSTLQE